MRRSYWEKNIFELIRRTSTSMPVDVENAIRKARRLEAAGSQAQWALDEMLAGIHAARESDTPLCPDTGALAFYFRVPVGFDTNALAAVVRSAVSRATRAGYLSQNTLDAVSGARYPTNIGHELPAMYFDQGGRKNVDVRLVMKSAASENEGAQFSLPCGDLGVDCDLNGVRACALETVVRAQHSGQGPGVLGICIGGDRSTGQAHARQQFLKKVGERSRVRLLSRLEDRILKDSRKLDIGPMGSGGKSALLGVSIDSLSRLPGSYFVTISYMGWALRRRGAVMGPEGGVHRWLY